MPHPTPGRKARPTFGTRQAQATRAGAGAQPLPGPARIPPSPRPPGHSRQHGEKHPARTRTPQGIQEQAQDPPGGLPQKRQQAHCGQQGSPARSLNHKRLATRSERQSTPIRCPRTMRFPDSPPHRVTGGVQQHLASDILLCRRPSAAAWASSPVAPQVKQASNDFALTARAVATAVNNRLPVASRHAAAASSDAQAAAP